MGEGISESEM